MKYKNESVFNLVQGKDYYKENDCHHSSDYFEKQMNLAQYSIYYNEDLESIQSNSSNSNLISNHNILNNNDSSDQTLSSSTNQLKLPINNSFINSTTMVTSSTSHKNRLSNRIPLPGELEANSSCFDTDSLIRLRNLRERNRVRYLNDGYDLLRKHLPNQLEFKKDKRLSKVQTLKLAISYIRQLQNILNTGGK